MNKITDYQKKMIGTKYTTKEGSEIVVLGVHSKKNNRTMYELSCSVCSLDPEMFPKGSITSLAESVRNKRTVCGCSVKYKCSENQYVTKINRRCDELGYLFNGFAEAFRGCDTLLDLYNPETCNRWVTTSIQSFILIGTKDPSEWESRRGQTCIKPDQHFVNNFNKTGVFLDGTEFWRVGSKRWAYSCPSCSKDEYVREGLCSGIFESSAGHLSSGKLSCRCGKNSYRWNTRQREYQVKEKLSGIKASFVGWESSDGYKNTRSKVIWICENSHENTQTFCNFIRRRGCRKCARNGFNPSLPAKLYLVKWKGENKSYLKFGITNNSVNERVVNQKAVSSLVPEILYTFEHTDGSRVDACEKEIKSVLDSGVCPKELLPRGYTETTYCTQENLDKLLEIIFKFNLKETK